MSTETSATGIDADQQEIARLYRSLHDAWNERDAATFAALFTEDGEVIGYDGSEMFGREEIASTLGQIFADHQTAAYVTKVRDVRLLTPNIARLRAVAGLVPPGQSDIAAQLNAIQTLIAVEARGRVARRLFPEYAHAVSWPARTCATVDRRTAPGS